MDSPAGAQRCPWLRSWVRDESFWRDVTARTLSGMLVVAITFTAGWAGGYFDGPDGRYLLLNTACAVVLLAAGVAAVLWVVRGIAAAEGPEQEGVFWRRGFVACGAVLVLMIGVTLVLAWAKSP